MTAHPYRLAPPRPVAQPPRRRFDPVALWLDVVGAAVWLATWPVARWRQRRAWAAYKRKLLADIMIEFEVKQRELWCRWWLGTLDGPARLAIIDAEAAMRRVRAEIDAAHLGKRRAMMAQRLRNDEAKARATARKGG